MRKDGRLGERQGAVGDGPKFTGLGLLLVRAMDRGRFRKLLYTCSSLNRRLQHDR